MIRGHCFRVRTLSVFRAIQKHSRLPECSIFNSPINRDRRSTPPSLQHLLVDEGIELLHKPLRTQGPFELIERTSANQ